MFIEFPDKTIINFDNVVRITQKSTFITLYTVEPGKTVLDFNSEEDAGNCYNFILDKLEVIYANYG